MPHGQRSPAPDAERGVDVRDIGLESLVFADDPVRTRGGADDVAELAQSIRTSGIIEPIIVRPSGQDRYEVVAGERRALAARSLEMATVPCIVRECSDEEALVIGIVENLQRSELNPMDRARGIRRLVAYGRSQEDIGATLGMAQSSVAHHLRLLSLPAAVAAMIEQGQLSMGHGKILVALTPEDAAELADECVRDALSVRELEQRASRLSAHASGTPNPTRPANADKPLREERELSNGVVVIVKAKTGSPGSGKIEIPYYSEEEKAWTLNVLAGTS